MTEAVQQASRVSPPFRLNFSLFGRFYILVYYAALFRPVLLILQILVFIGLPLWVNRYAVMHGDLGRSLIFMLVVLLIVYVVVPPLFLIVAWLNIRRQAMARGERRVGIAPDRVTGEGDLFQVAVDWKGVQKIDKVWDMIIFYTRPNAGILVPLSAFAPGEGDAFFSEAQSYFTAAHGPAAKSTLDPKA